MDVNTNNKAIKHKVMDQLVEGQEFTTQLQQVLSQSGLSLGPADDLVAKILWSFNNSISTLDSFKPVSSSSLAGSQNASSENDSKFEDSGDSRKRLAPVKGKRGCYKRQRKSETWTIESTVLHDAFSWRKYGQKEILNAKFPRSYFRCTHKYTQGCKATKQVQKVDLESKMFNITYIGHHTCNANEEASKPCELTNDEMSVDSEDLKSPSLEMKEEEENHQHGSSSDEDLSLVWQDIAFEDIYGCGETIATINVLCSKDLMVFGAGSEFGFNNSEELSIFGSCLS